MHVFTLANETKSGVKNRWWLERVARILIREEKTECPAFCDKEGYMLRSQDVERVFQPILKDLQKQTDSGMTFQQNWISKNRVDVSGLSEEER